MVDTYCGKNCKQCEQMQNNACIGCISETESAKSEKCLVAQCCKELKHNSCWKCGKREGCINYHSVITPNAGAIGKWMGMLFFIMIVGVIVSSLSLDMVLEHMPQLVVPSFVLSVLVAVVYAGILFVMSSFNYSYKVAGIAAIISLVPSVIAFIIGGDTAVGTIFKVIALVVSMISWYSEIDGHASVLADVDNILADKWRNVWNATICARLAMICGIFLMFIAMNLGANLYIVGSVGIVIVEILKFVYLYKTSNAFKRISGR